MASKKTDSKKGTRGAKPLDIAVKVTCVPSAAQAEQWRQMWRRLLSEPKGAENDESRSDCGAA